MGTIYQWLNFAILFLGLGFIITKKLGSTFKQQRTDLEAKMSAASAQHDQMKKDFEEAKSMLRGLDSRAEEMRSSTLREIQHETKRIEFESERLVEKMIQDGELKMKAEVAAMKAGLERELLSGALATARQTLKGEMNSKDSEWTSTMLQQEGMEGRKNYAS